MAIREVSRTVPDRLWTDGLALFILVPETKPRARLHLCQWPSSLAQIHLFKCARCQSFSSISQWGDSPTYTENRGTCRQTDNNERRFCPPPLLFLQSLVTRVISPASGTICEAFSSDINRPNPQKVTINWAPFSHCFGTQSFPPPIAEMCCHLGWL